MCARVRDRAVAEGVPRLFYRRGPAFETPRTGAAPNEPAEIAKNAANIFADTSRHCAIAVKNALSPMKYKIQNSCNSFYLFITLLDIMYEHFFIVG